MASLKFQPLLIVSLICSSKDNFLCFLYFLWSEWVIAKRLAGYCNSKDETFASLLCWISFKPNKIHFLFFKFHSGNARYPQLVYYYNNNNNLLQYRFRRCWSTPLYESHPLSLWSLQITITLTEPTTLDLCSHSQVPMTSQLQRSPYLLCISFQGPKLKRYLQDHNLKVEFQFNLKRYILFPKIFSTDSVNFWV